MDKQSPGRELAKAYDPKIAEDKWYSIWEREGLFRPEANADIQTGETFSVVIPPPNVTGSLHIGHALNHTLQDVLVRHARKSGKKTLWVPGMDHAGIATQNVVERLLAEEKKTRFDLGREDFEKRVWQWKAESGGTIKNQQKKLGESVDWSHERFTLDDGLSEAVKEVFIQLYKEGLIYRGNRIINWSPKGNTALSDIEVEFKEKNGHFYHLRYPVKDSDEHLVIATTRPETMLGDAAVAAHPDDERYKQLKGKKVILPLVDREIPIIFDHYVDPEFGSGLVKITPAHDFNDYEVAARHDLPATLIMDERAHINANGGPYKGLYRFKARKKIIEDLDALGLLDKVEDHKHMVGYCYRTHDEVEPILSTQWFVNVKEMARRAIDVVEDGSIEFIPRVWEKTYFEWMNNIRDWCISRQLWWGHRIPAWYCDECNHLVVSKEAPAKCESCGWEKMVQEEDVLDTWFSSGLWPFSTLGWPEKTDELRDFYPTSVLVTGFDIIFFWVARMIMFGLKFQDEIPFRKVLIHGLVRDEKGQKFSKSKGNVVDPLVMMEKYGTDAFRFFLMATLPEGKDIIFNENRLEGYRAFCNKIWNSSRFIFMNLPADFDFKKSRERLLKKITAADASLKPADYWILEELNQTISACGRALETYRFHEYANRVYDFIWKSFCDWYIEYAKNRVFGHEGEEAKTLSLDTLTYCLFDALQLLNPVMPYLTEELTESLAGVERRAIVTAWPEIITLPEKQKDAGVAHMETVMDFIRSVRNLRAEMNIPPGNKIEAIVVVADSTPSFDILKPLAGEENSHPLFTLARLSKLRMETDYRPGETDGSTTFRDGHVYVPLEGAVDLEKEKARLSGQLEKARKNLSGVEKKLSNKNFVEKANPAAVEKEKDKRARFEKEVRQLEEALARFEG